MIDPTTASLVRSASGQLALIPPAWTLVKLPATEEEADAEERRLKATAAGLRKQVEDANNMAIAALETARSRRTPQTEQRYLSILGAIEELGEDYQAAQVAYLTYQRARTERSRRQAMAQDVERFERTHAAQREARRAAILTPDRSRLERIREEVGSLLGR